MPGSHVSRISMVSLIDSQYNWIFLVVLRLYLAILAEHSLYRDRCTA